MTRLEGEVQALQAEVSRRKFMDAKVQTYVRSLIQQNERCKEFIKSSGTEPISGERGTHFLQSLQLN